MISATVPILRSYVLPGLMEASCTGRSRTHGLACLHSSTSLPESRHVSHVLSYAALKNPFRVHDPESFP